MDKIKEFLSNKWTKLVCWIIWFLDTGLLILGGTDKVEFSNGVTITLGIISAIGLLVTFIKGKLTKK